MRSIYTMLMVIFLAVSARAEQICVDIPDGSKARVVNGVAKGRGYRDKIADKDNNNKLIDNPKTKNEFLREEMVKWVQEMVRTGEINEAVDAARQQAERDAATLTDQIQ